MGKLELSDVVETHQLGARYRVDELLNPWLQAGWRILHVWTVDRGDPQSRQEESQFLLGWPIHQGNPVKPEKKPSEWDHKMTRL